jgi:hypothetical protein
MPTRWLGTWEPFVDEIVRACVDDHIETGRIDLVDDLATPGPRLGPGVDATVAKLQRICTEQGLARPITELTESATIVD